MTLAKITAADITNWDSLDDIAASLEKRGLERHPDLGNDNRIVLELADGEFMELVEAGAGKSATDYKPGSVTRHTNLVSTDDFETFTFITRQRDWDAHGRIKYQQFSFEKEQFRSETGEKNTVLQKLNEIEYGQSAAVMDDLYDTRQIVKEFYEQFEDLRTDLVQEVSGIPDDRGDAKGRYVQVLLDRMIFLYFIQEKNLLDYDAEYLHTHHQHVVDEGGDVYEDFYDPLFFEMLAEGKNDPEFGKLPYLNGGLFSKNPIEEEFEDAKLGEDPKETNALFGRILDFLSDWNWNVDERLDIVDPKNLSPAVLGHIFEQTVNQKEMGAYYTPEEITGFMARRTIHPYLLDQLNEAEGTNYESIDDLFSLDAASAEESSGGEAVADGGAVAHEVNIGAIEQDHVETLYFDVLKQARVLDPAVGSGAFLLAAQEVLLDIYLQCIEYFAAQEDHKPFELTDQIKNELETIRTLNGNESLYAKRSIILNNLFGVDIDEGAVEICKLRLWLSMVADIEDEPEEVEPLPNIDFNIRQGNSLLGYTELEEVNIEGDKPLTNWGGGVGPSVQELYEEVIEAIEEHKQARSGSEATQARKKAEQRIQTHQDNLDNKLLSEFDNLGIDLSVDQLQECSPFHWILEFATVYQDGGFDVVLGNPPYIRIQELKSSQSEIVDYLKESAKYQTPYYNYDIAIPFLERTSSLLHDESYFSFIMTNKWLQTRYGKKLRKLMSENRKVSSIVDFTDQQVFEGISTYVMLAFLTGSPNETIEYSEIDDLGGGIQARLEEATQRESNDFITSFDASYEPISSDPWTFVPKNEAKILSEIAAHPELGDICERIFQGIITGRDGIFILDIVEENEDHYIGYSDSLEEFIKIESGIAKPLIKGNQFSKWRTTDYDKVVIYPYELYVEDGQNEADLISESQIQSKYPSTYEYLCKHKDELEGREGGKWEGEDNWFEFSRRQNIEQFNQEKLMTSVLNKQSKFSIDLKDELVFVGGGNAGGYGLRLEDEHEISLTYLLGVINSRLLEWNLKNISSQFRNDYYSYGKKYIENLPIVIGDPEIVEDLTRVLIEISEKSNPNEEIIVAIENLLDMVVYEMYFEDLTSDTTKYITSHVGDGKQLRSNPADTIKKIEEDRDFKSEIKKLYSDERVSLIEEENLRENNFRQ